MTLHRTALVTGSAGFVGRHMARALEEAGWFVVRCDPAHGYGHPLPECRTVFASAWRPDLVVHCAAVVGGRATIDGDPLALAVDLELDAALFRWAARVRPERVVYFSSSAAYPVKLQQRLFHHPLSEAMVRLDDVEQPDAIYGWIKLTGERLARHAREAGVPVTVLRPFSGYGGDQALDYPFPSFVDRARRRVERFDIWGDGTQVRDWVHIDDVVATTMLCVDQGIDGPLNIGTGRPTSFDDLAAMVCRAAGYWPHFEHHPDAPTGVHTRLSAPALLDSIRVPRVSLEEGVMRAMYGRLAA